MKKDEQNAARLLALLSYFIFRKEVKEVAYTQHWSGKYCPHRTLDLDLERLLNMAEDLYKEIEERQNNTISKLTSVDETLTYVLSEMLKLTYNLDCLMYWLKRHVIPKDVTPENYGKMAEVINTLHKQGAICKRMIDNLKNEVIE